MFDRITEGKESFKLANENEVYLHNKGDVQGEKLFGRRRRRVGDGSFEQPPYSGAAVQITSLFGRRTETA